MKILEIFQKNKEQINTSKIISQIFKYSSRIILIIGLLLAFMLAIEFIKTSIEAFSEDLKNNIVNYLKDPIASLGIGWLTSFLTLNSTSVATIAINLSDRLQDINGFFLILGSRIGASAIILMLGIMFYLKGQSYKQSIDIGIITFLAVVSTSALAAFFGRIIHYFNIDATIANNFHKPGPGPLGTFISDSLTHDAAMISLRNFGPIITFLLGFILIVLVIDFLDKVFYIIDFSEMNLQNHPFKNKIIQRLHTPIFAFILGFIFTALTLSITVSISILIPIYAHSSLRSKIRELFTSEKRIASQMILPYALGANLGSYIDTIILASISGSTIGLSLMYNVLISSILAVIILALMYRMFSDVVIKISDWAVSKSAYLPEIIILLIVIPLLFAFRGNLS